eukprot:jgi/Hompol1/1709/HPOL_003464-RA
MFGELKNYKDIASRMTSMKHTIIIINSVFEKIDETIADYESLEKIKALTRRASTTALSTATGSGQLFSTFTIQSICFL